MHIPIILVAKRLRFSFPSPDRSSLSALGMRLLLRTVRSGVVVDWSGSVTVRLGGLIDRLEYGFLGPSERVGVVPQLAQCLSCSSRAADLGISATGARGCRHAVKCEQCGIAG
jgi:hypothetical protein